MRISDWSSDVCSSDLEQIEDFRALAQNAQQVVTSTKKLKKAKREQDGELDPGQKKEQSDTAKQRKEIREKLQKFLARIPVFMYVTDFREEALKDVIESLDSRSDEHTSELQSLMRISYAVSCLKKKKKPT